MPKATCSIEGCGKPVHGRDWCMKHYMRWRTHGDPRVTRNRAWNKGVPMRPESIAKLRARTVTNETRQRIRDNWNPACITPERNRKIGDAQRGKRKSPSFVEKISGPNNYRWRGGSLARKLNSREWRALRMQCLDRDNHICQRCGQRGNIAHHIIEYRDGGADELDNLLTLCRSCHAIIHHQVRGISISKSAPAIVDPT